MFRTLKLALHGLAPVLFLAIALGAASAQTRVNTISVDGNQRVPDSTIVSLIDASPGEVLSADQINDAVQRIMGSGLFETAEIQPVAGACA